MAAPPVRPSPLTAATSFRRSQSSREVGFIFGLSRTVDLSRAALASRPPLRALAIRAGTSGLERPNNESSSVSVPEPPPPRPRNS